MINPAREIICVGFYQICGYLFLNAEARKGMRKGAQSFGEKIQEEEVILECPNLKFII